MNRIEESKKEENNGLVNLVFDEIEGRYYGNSVNLIFNRE